MNDNLNSPVVWNKESDLSYMGLLKSGITNLWTSSKHVDGKIEGALSFDGSSNYIEIPSNTYFDFSDGFTDLPFSVSFWIKPTNLANVATLIEQVNTWSIRISNGVISFWIFDPINLTFAYATSSYLIIPATQWYNLTINYDGTDINGVNFYVNGAISGKAVFTSPTYQTMNILSEKMYIGGDPTYWPTIPNSFNGCIDNIVVVNRELSDIEIEGLYNRRNGTEDCQGTYKYTSSSSSSEQYSSSSSSSSSSSIDSSSSSNSSSSSSSSFDSSSSSSSSSL
jgi:uncharacterized membrane protein YgcG